MSLKPVADKASIFVGVAFILIALIVGTGGILWKNFIEYTSSSSHLPEVFEGITAQPPYNPSLDPENRDEIIFAFSIPRGDLVQFLEIVQPRLDEIVEKTGKTARIIVTNNELEIVNKVEKRLVDFGSLSSFEFIEFRKKRQIKAILERFSMPPKRSLFVVRANSHAQKISDLRGMRIAYRSNDSLSGFLVPLKELKKLEIDHTTFFAQEFFSENYSDSILGLQNDHYDCIILSSNFFHEQPDSIRKTMKILHESDTLPGGVYITSSQYRNPYEQIVTGNMMKLAEKIDHKQTFAGMFTVKQPDEASFDLLEKEFAGGH